MSTFIIFFIGLFLALMTFVAVFLIGLEEATDPHLSDSDELTKWEKSLAGEQRAKNIAEEEASLKRTGD